MKVLNENLSEGKDELNTPGDQLSLNTSQNNSNGKFLKIENSCTYFV